MRSSGSELGRLLCTACALLAAHAYCASLAPTPQCVYMTGSFECQQNNNITVSGRNLMIAVDCQGTKNVSCDDFLALKEITDGVGSVSVSGCPAHALLCLSKIVPNASELILYQLSEPLSADHVRHFTSLARLDVQLSDADTGLSISAIKALPSLVNLVISGGNLELPANTFNNTPPIQSLKLNNNNISTIWARCFSVLEKLTELEISNNDISYIKAKAFDGLGALESLFLTSNKIKYIEMGAFSSPHVEIFNVKVELPSLAYIKINENKVEINLSSRVFGSLPALTYLEVTDSQVRSLPEDLFLGSGHIKRLNLNNNSIEELTASMFSHLVELRALILANNRLQVLPEGVFMGLKELQILNLHNNQLIWLPDHLLPINNNLQLLYLSRNRIHKLSEPFTLDWQASYLRRYRKTEFNLGSYSPFRYLNRLVGLDLNNNFIKSLYEGWQMDLLHIKYVDLSGNWFTSIKDFNVDFSQSDIEINLSRNYIRDVALDPRVAGVGQARGATSTLVLDDNPIRCDCNSYGLYLRLQGHVVPREPAYLLNTTCADAPTLLLKDLSPNQLVCHLPRPDSCSQFMYRPHSNLIIGNCSRLPPDFSDIDRAISNLSISRFIFASPAVNLTLGHQPTSFENVTVTMLNLSAAGLYNVTFLPTPKLRVLDLSYNNLDTIPYEFLKENMTLYLSNNPLECECFFIKELFKNIAFLADFKQLSCADGSSVAQIDVHALCYKDLLYTSRIGCSVVGALVLVIAACKIGNNYKEIWESISRPLRKKPSRDSIVDRIAKRLDAAKHFDLFISFAHRDEQFVTECLLPILETTYHQKVCVHHRDWMVGELITDQIIKSVENSRRTIIVLTEHFVTSEWAYLEFHTAHNMSIQEGKPRVIIIILDENIINDERVDRDLKSYIVVNTYLLWGEPDFWEKMRKVLPRQGKKKLKA